MSPMGKGGEKTSQDLIIGTLTVMALVAGAILAVSAPAEKLLGAGLYRFHSAIHGLAAGVFMITVTIGLFEAFRLWAGEEIRIRELEIGSLVNAAACFLTILSGNWIYIPYRAATGPRSHFMATVPEIHKIFFEFKEFGALFTLPLAVGAAFLILRYGKSLEGNRLLRETVALLLVLTFFYFVVAFGLGAAITKLMSV